MEASPPRTPDTMSETIKDSFDEDEVPETVKEKARKWLEDNVVGGKDTLKKQSPESDDVRTTSSLTDRGSLKAESLPEGAGEVSSDEPEKKVEDDKSKAKPKPKMNMEETVRSILMYDNPFASASVLFSVMATIAAFNFLNVPKFVCMVLSATTFMGIILSNTLRLLGIELSSVVHIQVDPDIVTEAGIKSAMERVNALLQKAMEVLTAENALLSFAVAASFALLGRLLSFVPLWMILEVATLGLFSIPKIENMYSDELYQYWNQVKTMMDMQLGAYLKRERSYVSKPKQG